MSTESHNDTLTAMRSDIAPEVAAFRESLEDIEPSPRHRASMERMLVELVREDVAERWRRRTRARGVGAAWRRWNDAWRELFERSLVFRIASQGAMALGAGLVLAVLMTAPESESSARAFDEPEMETPVQRPIPVPAIIPREAEELRRLEGIPDRRGLSRPLPDKR